MKRYFEVTYPRRLKELKDTLDELAVVVYAPETKEAEGMEAIKLAQGVVYKFAENTKLHITNKRPERTMVKEDMQYQYLVTAEYLLHYLRENHSLASEMFKAIYKNILPKEEILDEPI